MMIKHLRNYFITGLIIFIPLIATIYIVWISFNFFDSLLKPVVKRLIGDIPGVSLIITIVLIFLLGFIGTNTVGRRFMKYLESTLMKIPIVSGVYYTIKEASNIFLVQNGKKFKSVVLVEFPKKGTYAIGFTAGITVGEIQDKTGQHVVNVFVPTTPNPTTGFFMMFPKEEIIQLDMTMDEAFRLILSGGLTQK